ncbi:MULTISPECIES: hypothetical protein [Gordonia]|uniref:Uncharacterized protein n=1 Tax=Gordonia sihwensis NBRC 108236 TaxID=1223544 RepID=L7LPJ2_9ACTN|nr:MULTISPECIES: hypothetical protein [Gordonia]AUH67250.1 hypothetical protein CXX93_01310 [Gordonia sp. YC-JH1]GAC62052.1 hypothetical protein GSI01S_28_00210 [Gordonia sihwensis NBRC 108236]
MDRSSQPAPGYRPPLAPGQSYPPLGYSEHGAPLFTYDDRERALAGPQPAAAPPDPTPPAPAPQPPPDRRRGLAVGVAVVAVGVLCLALAFRMFPTGDDGPVRRADPPAAQSTDDPYLQGLPDQPEQSVPRDPDSAQPPVHSGAATVEYQVDSGRATILYVDDTSVKIERNAGGTWRHTVRGSQNALLRVSVILSDTDPASCSITVDGKVVDRQTTQDAQSSGMLTCRYEG